jgi:succinoglycan biosynthesis transport protein ExoP
LVVEVLPDSSVLQVRYEWTSRNEALDVVTELARVFTRQVDQTLGVELGRRAGGTSFALVVRTFDPPHVERVPTSPVAKVFFAGIVGLALGFMLAIAREALDARMRGSSDAETWFRAPVVGALPKGMRGKSPPGVGDRHRRGDSRRVASLDLIRARLQFAIGSGGPTIVVTSAAAEDGKSTVVANLGAALAWAGKRVVCVDADVRRPSLHRYLGLEAGLPGLVDVLEADVVLEDALMTVDLVQPTINGSSPAEAPGRLELLPAGSTPSAAVGLLTPEAVGAIIQRLHERADYVVFDSPPLLVADSFPLAMQSDNVLVVARRGRTTKDQAEAVRATLEGLGIQKVGVVMTDAASADGYA